VFQVIRPVLGQVVLLDYNLITAIFFYYTNTQIRFQLSDQTQHIDQVQ